MKILKQGKLIKPMTGTCIYCNCEYEYVDSDIYTEYNLTIVSYEYVVCPCCGHKNYICNYTPYTPTVPQYPPYNPPITLYQERNMSRDTTWPPIMECKGDSSNE